MAPAMPSWSEQRYCLICESSKVSRSTRAKRALLPPMSATRARGDERLFGMIPPLVTLFLIGGELAGCGSLPMKTGEGWFCGVEMGGMVSVVKVREGLPAGDYRDPGWYKQPQGAPGPQRTKCRRA